MRTSKTETSPRSLAALLTGTLLAALTALLLGGCGGGDEAAPVTLVTPTAVLETAQAVSASIGRAGGTLTATATDGTTYALTIPADALPGPIQITMTPVARIDGLPLSGGLAGAVDLQPSGTVLARTAVLTITTTRTVPAGLTLAGFAIASGGSALQRAWALQSGGIVRVGLTGFSTHGAGYGTLQDVQQLVAPSGGRTQAEDDRLAAAQEVLSSATTTADEKLEAYLALYDEVIEPMIRRAQNDVELAWAIAEYVQWDQNLYDAWTFGNPAIRATWDPWYLPIDGLNEEILARAQAWGGLAAPKLRQAYDANNALCASQKSLGALRNTLFYARQIQQTLSTEAQNANGIDPASLARDLCARLVVSSLTLADPLQITVPSDLDVAFELLFEGQTEGQAVPVQVEFSGVNATFGKSSPANSNVQGQFTLSVAAQAAGSPVTVFLKGCLILGADETTGFAGVVEPLLCIDEVVQRSGPPAAAATVLPPDGFTNIDARDMNASGHVVGLMSNNRGGGGAFVWRGGSPTLLPNLSDDPACVPSDAFGINGRGDIVGLSCGVPVLWPAGGSPVNLAATAAGVGWVLQTAEFINGKGQIVGRGVRNGVGGFYFLDTDNSITRIEGVSSVLDLSEDGDVVGWLPTSGTGYLWRRGETRIDIQGNVFSVNSVASGRVVAGNARSGPFTRGVIWGPPYTSAEITEIVPPVSGYTTFPQHIGDDRSVVGFFTGPDPSGGRDFIKAFHWKDGRFTDLSSLYGAGTLQQTAFRVGEGGFVLLNAIRATSLGNQNFFMVVPRP